MKKKTKIILIVVGAFFALIAIIGGIKIKEAHADMKSMSEKEYMIKVAKEHQKEMDEQLCHGDKDHHIKTITYEWDTVKHNPMGGIMIKGYVNQNKDLDFELIFEKNSDGEITCRLMESAPEIAQWKGF